MDELGEDKKSWDVDRIQWRCSIPSKGTADKIVDSWNTEGMRRNSNEYLKFKPERTEERNDLLKVQLAVKNKVNLNEIPGFLEPKRVRPKITKSDKIANTHGLMSGWNILKELEERKKVKDGAAKLKEMKGHLQLDLRKSLKSAT